jgi:hypothetical protein
MLAMFWCLDADIFKKRGRGRKRERGEREESDDAASLKLEE